MPGIHNGIGTTFRSQAFGGAPSVNPNFVSTWDTTQAGSASNTVVLPLLSGGTYNGTIDWGDGNTSALSYANRTHVYASSGIYTITISGSDIQGFRFNNGGDRRKITDISNWGNLTITTSACFYGCSNLQVSATDAPTISTTTLESTFRACTSLTTPDFSAWDLVGVQNVLGMFYEATPFNGNIGSWDMSTVNRVSYDISGFTIGMLERCYAFNQDISGWDLSNVSSFYGFLANCQSLNCPIGNWNITPVRIGLMLSSADNIDDDLSGWDITSLNNATNFMSTATGLSTVNYDATLIGWESQLQATWAGGAGYPYTISIHFGGSKYTGGGAADAARTSLITNFGWTITDGGSV